MNWSMQLRHQSRRQARHAGALARLRGFSTTLCSGRRQYRLDVVAPAVHQQVPLRVCLQSSLGRGHVELELAALEPALDPALCARLPPGALAAQLAHSGDWWCLLEGLFGTALQLTAASLHRRRSRIGLALQIEELASGRIGHLGIAGPALLAALQRRVDVVRWRALQRRQALGALQLAAVVCLRACRLSVAQLARATPGALIRISDTQPLLRLALMHGVIDFPVAIEDRTCMIQAPQASLPPDPATPLVPFEQLALGVDVVLASLRLGIEDIARLRPGATLELPLPLQHSAVILRCEGTPFARGELVRIGDRLGVLVEQINAAPSP